MSKMVNEPQSPQREACEVWYEFVFNITTSYIFLRDTFSFSASTIFVDFVSTNLYFFFLLNSILKQSYVEKQDSDHKVIMSVSILDECWVWTKYDQNIPFCPLPIPTHVFVPNVTDPGSQVRIDLWTLLWFFYWHNHNVVCPCLHIWTLTNKCLWHLDPNLFVTTEDKIFENQSHLYSLIV